MLKTGSLLTLLYCLSCVGFAAETENLIVNGDFSDGQDGWTRYGQPGLFAIREEDGKKYLRMTGGMLGQDVKLKSEWTHLAVSARMRCKGLVVGDAAWKNFRVALAFKNKDGKSIKYPAMPETSADLPDWLVKKVTIPIPEQATMIEVKPSLFGKAGTCDVTDIVVQPVVRKPEKPLTPVDLAFQVRTSTRKNTIGFFFDVKNVGKAGTAQVQALIRDAEGKVVKKLRSTVKLQAASLQSGFVEFPWKDAVRWDIDNPHQYTVTFAVRGEGIKQDFESQFGFREFWIEGRSFFLNGKEIRLRTGYFSRFSASDSHAVLEAVKETKALGYNFIEVWPGPGKPERYQKLNRDLAEACSKLGMGMAAAAPHLKDFNKCNTDADVERFSAAARKQMIMSWNHPSVWMWNHSANQFISGRDQDPKLIGRKGWTNVREEVARFAKGERVCDAIKEIDPTRPVFSHAGGPVGDVYNLNNYLCMLPLQEREEWLSDWATNGTMPYMGIEFGTPLWTSFMRNRESYGPAVSAEPFMTEWAAVYFGPAAYKMETSKYRGLIKSKHKSGYEYSSWRDPWIIQSEENWSEIQKLFIRNTWRSWRTMGITGGMNPWFEGKAWMQPLVEPYNQPEMAWICGPKDAFTDKAHLFKSGQRVEKQIAILNDHRKVMNAEVSWIVEVDGKKIAENDTSGSLQVAETAFMPVTFTAPTVAKKTDGRILMTVKMGDKALKDEFSFRVFPKQKKSTAQLTVYDPVGDSSAMLKDLGYALKPAGVEPTAPVVIVGRKVLSDRNLLPFDVIRYVRNGGRLVILGQDPKWLQHALGFRVAEYLCRRAYPVNATHPVTTGLDAEDMRDWAGVSKVVEPYPEETNGAEPWFDPAYGHHWGNRGAVSSAAIEKPHRSSWRPILECEFDLAYTPLMEMECGKGRVILCTLDLEDHYRNDAGAAALAKRTIDYAASSVQAKTVRASLIGSSDALNVLGVFHDQVDASPSAGLLVVAPGRGTRESAILEYARSGGKVLVLPRKQGKFLGTEIASVPDFQGSTDVPAWPEAAGISISDIHVRAPYEASILKVDGSWELAAAGILARKKMGSGVIVMCQADAESIPANAKTYLRFTRWRQTRILAQLCANMGASFAQDKKLLELIQKPNVAYMLSGTWKGQLTKAIPEPDFRKPNPDPGITPRAKQCVSINAPEDGWIDVHVPAYWESYGEEFRFIDGEMVFRKVLEIPAYAAGKDLMFSLGRVDETEETWWNGVKIASSRDWLQPRRHIIPGKHVKAGRNILAIRTWDEMVHGGWCGITQHVYLAGTDKAELYHNDYLEAFGKDNAKLSDDPYRYKRW